MALGDSKKSKNIETDPEFEKFKKFNKSLKDEQLNMLNFQDEYIKNYSVGLGNVANTMSGIISAASEGFKKGLFDDQAIKLLEEQAQGIANSFGVSRGRIEEFKQIIADASPELVKIGIDQTKAAENYQAITKEMGGVVGLGTEAIVEMSAAAKVSGVEVGLLAKEFRNVGVSMYDVGDQMRDVANYARSVGVSVSAVSTGVVNNLGKLNTFNFDGGVNGLAKMAAQAARLGIDMSKVFKIADDLFSPEKAIDMSAALQRLGVTSSGLLDPLRAMDMAQNDPAALQNEILNISKEFTKFNEVTGKMEILPGSKRRLREVAEAMGMTAEELAGMSIKAADFDKKMSQIKLPDFAEGNEETKQLIASMAEMKGGVATINVKDEKTGEVLLKQVDQLTPEDIEKLKNSQTEQAKSVEQLAYDQLTQLQQINSGINGVKAAAVFGTATSEPVEKLYNTMMQTSSTIAKDYADRSQASDFRKITTDIVQPAENFLVSGIKGDKQGQSDSIDMFLKNLVTLEEEQMSVQQRYFEETLKNVQQVIQKSYDTPREINSNSKMEVTLKIDGDPNLVNKLDQNQLTNNITSIITEPNFVAQYRNTLLGGTAPSATVGGKNQP
jgi:hypothetical protein